MKKSMFVLTFMFAMVGMAKADQSAVKSSCTASADTGYISHVVASGTVKLVYINVLYPAAAGSYISWGWGQFSTGTASNVMRVDTTIANQFYFDHNVSSGIVYGNAGGATACFGYIPLSSDGTYSNQQGNTR